MLTRRKFFGLAAAVPVSVVMPVPVVRTPTASEWLADMRAAAIGRARAEATMAAVNQKMRAAITAMVEAPTAKPPRTSNT